MTINRFTKSNIQNLYENHHSQGKAGFSIWENERAKFFKNWIGKGKKILDLGCRDGTLTRHFVEGNNVTGIDIDKNMLAICKKDLGIKTVHLNLYEKWPFQNSSFDVIVMGEVLEHLFTPEIIIKKVASVLSDNGIFIGSVPNFYHLKRRLLFLLGKPVDVFEDPTHVTVFSKDKLEIMLKDHFSKVDIVGLGRKSHSILMTKYASLLAHTLLFKAS